VETAVGTVQPVHEAAVASKLLARVAEVNVRAGQTINQGDVLVRLDDADLAARLKQAEAGVASAEAVHERATVDYQRAESLIAQRTISQQEHDAARAALRTAQAELERFQQAVHEAKVLLDFATLRSPLTGVVIDKRVEPGDTASPGQVLVTLYEPNRMQMVATVRESLAMRLAVGDQIPARLDAVKHECLATVSEIVPEAESASRSFTVKVTGPCPPGVYSGMFGRISIPLDEEEVLVVPAAAVLHVGQLHLVEVIQNGKLRRRNVQLGRELDGNYEVLAGLEAGERVVLQQAFERLVTRD
jgi:RND family efflux transporter MFP subunit